MAQKHYPKIFDTMEKMSWCFAIINGRLAEIYFGRKKGKNSTKQIIWAHCYVKKSEYKIKREQKMILEDTKKYRFSYRNKKYKRIPITLPLKRLKIR